MPPREVEVKFGIGCFLLAVVVQLTLLTLLVYAVIHFVLKFW